MILPYLRALRLERWPRSAAIFVGIAALPLLDRSPLASGGWAGAIARAGGAFLLTWVVSTVNYIINEIADAPFDVHHPTKSQRPLVKGEVKRGPLLALGAVLAAGSLAAARLLFSAPFFLSLLALLVAGFLYNIPPVRTKDIPFLDSISESMNNPIRFAVGWFAFQPAAMPPVFLLAAWWAFGNFLMVAKRLSEFRWLGERAGDYRASLRRYTRTLLVAGMGASILVFFAAYFLFAARYRLLSFAVLSPFLAFYFFLFFRKTLRETEVMEEPERLLIRPKYALYTLFLVALYAAALLLHKVAP